MRFRHEVLKMLKAEGKINDAVIENMLSWRHSGFNVYCGPTIWPNDEKALEDPVRYIIRACFSQERMTYLPANRYIWMDRPRLSTSLKMDGHQKHSRRLIG